MTNIDQASTVASNIPDAAKYAAPAQIAPVVDQPALDRRFDGRMHSKMNAARSESDWGAVRDILANAHKAWNLRANVRERFLKDCPHADVLASFKTAIGYVDPEEKRRLAQEKRERHEAAAKERKKQEELLANEKFDQRMIAQMKAGKWEAVSDILLRANEQGNLRAAVRLNFLKYCPEQYYTGFLEATASFGPAPTRPKKLTAAEAKKRRDENRAARQKQQPLPGAKKGK